MKKILQLSYHILWPGTKHCTASRDWCSITGPTGGDTEHLFLTFGGAGQGCNIANCPLVKVLTCKNLYIKYANNEFFFFFTKKKNWH